MLIIVGLLNCGLRMGGVDETLIGAVICFASTNIKTGWLPCNGQEVGRNQYPELFAMISTMYGTPSNGGVFKLPNLNGNSFFFFRTRWVCGRCDSR